MDYNRDFTSVAKQIDFATLKPSQAAEAAEAQGKRSTPISRPP